jgi:hypothetical protein
VRGSLPPGGARESNGDRKRAPKAFQMLFKGSLSAAEADAARVAGFSPRLAVPVPHAPQ